MMNVATRVLSVWNASASMSNIRRTCSSKLSNISGGARAVGQARRGACSASSTRFSISRMAVRYSSSLRWSPRAEARLEAAGVVGDEVENAEPATGGETSERLGQAVVIENSATTGVAAWNAVAKSQPDGYLARMKSAAASPRGQPLPNRSLTIRSRTSRSSQWCPATRW